MIDKHEYYHGAAIVRLLQDERCVGLRKRGALGYIVNDRVFTFVKYTTKARTPWRFSFDQEDVDRANRMAAEHPEVVMAFVCGGDGVCGVRWDECRRLLENKQGWIAAARKHNELYAVWGSKDGLERKVSLKRWPDIAFVSDVSPEVQ